MNQSIRPALITVAVLRREAPVARADTPDGIKAFWDKVHRQAS